MKGPFFINFMIIMSCICVCSAVLWNYIYRRSRWLALVVFVAAATVIAGAGLSYYGRVFPAVQWPFPSWSSPLPLFLSSGVCGGGSRNGAA